MWPYLFLPLTFRDNFVYRVIIIQIGNNYATLFDLIYIYIYIYFIKWSLVKDWKQLCHTFLTWYVIFFIDYNTTTFKNVTIIHHPRVGQYAFGFFTSTITLQALFSFSFYTNFHMSILIICKFPPFLHFEQQPIINFF